MSAITPHTSRAAGTILTAAVYNADHLNHTANATTLNTDKVETSRSITTANGLQGGGNLSADRALSPDYATQAEAEAGISTSKSMNPLRVAQAISTQVGYLNDPLTKVLLSFNGTDASTVITDSAANGSAHVWTAAGNAQIDTAQSKFGGASGLFDGTGDYVTTPDHADFTLGSGNFTIDCWFYCNAAGGSTKYIAAQSDVGATNTLETFLIWRSPGNVLNAAARVGTSFFAVTGTTQYTNAVNTGWHHCAFVRTGDVLRLFLDGVQEGGDVAITGTVNNSAYALSVGRRGEFPSDPWLGWIDEFRMSVGVARWDADFTPPINAFTVISGPFGALQYNADGFLGSVVNTSVDAATGVVTQTAASGEGQRFFNKIDPLAIWASAPLFTEAIASFAGVNSGAPANDAFGVAAASPNIVWTSGWNFATGGGRLDTAKPAFGFSLEYNYFINTSAGWKRGVEGHWKLQDAATGAEHRLISCWAPWDGGVGSTISLNMDTIQLSRFDALAADAARIGVDFTTANFTQINFQQRTLLQFPVNAVAIMQQRNAADTNYVALPFINASNALSVGTPVSVNATSVDVNGAIMTLGLSSATLANNQLGMFMSASAAAGANINPWKSSIASTGTVDFASWNLGGGHSYFSSWVAVGSGDAANVFNVNGGGIWTAGLDNSDDDSYVVSQNNGLGTNNALRLDRTTLRADFGGPARLKSYTVAGLPSASTAGAGALAYVSNASGGPTLACSDGTNWKVVAALGATVT